MAARPRGPSRWRARVRRARLIVRASAPPRPLFPTARRAEFHLARGRSGSGLRRSLTAHEGPARARTERAAPVPPAAPARAVARLPVRASPLRLRRADDHPRAGLGWGSRFQNIPAFAATATAIPTARPTAATAAA